MNLTETIKKLLIADKTLRSSDKKLMWEYWKAQGIIHNGYVTHSDFIDKAELPENIRRCRQKIQETSPELKPSDTIQKMRENKAQEYRKRIPVFDNVNNTMRYIVV